MAGAAWILIDPRKVGATPISRTTFLRAVGVFTFLETLLAVAAARLVYAWSPSWQLLLVVLVATCVCAVLLNVSQRLPMVACAAAGMSVSFGALAGWLSSSYRGQTVVQAIVLTGTVIALMSIAGATWPRVFEGRGPYLIGALWIALCGASLAARGSSPQTVPLSAWVGLILFAAYVAYAWTQAARRPHTVENAIWFSSEIVFVALFLFFKAIEVMGRQPQLPADQDRRPQP